MEPASTNLQVNAKKSKKRIVIIAAAAVAILLVAVGIAIMLIFADAEKKAKAAAEKYDKELTEYVEQLSKSKTIAATKSKLSTAPKLEEVNFGERIPEYNIAKSQAIIQQTYRDRLSAMLNNFTDYSFDKDFRALDSITNDLVYKESDAGRKAERELDAKSSELSSELLKLKFSGIPETDKSYVDKKAESDKANIERAAKPLIDSYSVRLEALRRYKDRLAAVKANALADIYKQGMLRGVDDQISSTEQVIEEFKKAKTPGEARRSEYRYRSISYTRAEAKYNNARWASEEVYYVSPSAYIAYVFGAMKYAAHDAAIPADQQKAKLYGDVLYYGHQASTTIPKEQKYYSRTIQAKLHFGLDELKYKIEKSNVDKSIKEKYLKQVNAATTELVLPAGELSREQSGAYGIERFISFVNFKTNYTGVGNTSGVSSTDASEASMRSEAKALRDLYSTVKKELLPRGENGKKEREALVKQTDACMDTWFTYNDKTIERALTLSKIKGDLTVYMEVSDQFSKETDKIGNQFVACTKKVTPLYEKALKQADNYANAREFAVKQLAAIQ